MSQINIVMENLYDKFGFQSWSCVGTNEVIVNGHLYEEATNFTAVFDLYKIANRQEHFSNDHRITSAHVISQDIVVDETTRYPLAYHRCFQREYPNALHHLFDDIHSRRALIHFFDPAYDVQPCLISLQFFVRQNTIDVFANFRSWELEEWAIYDLQLIGDISQKLLADLTDGFTAKLELGVLTINTPSAHVIL